MFNELDQLNHNHENCKMMKKDFKKKKEKLRLVFEKVNRLSDVLPKHALKTIWIAINRWYNAPTPQSSWTFKQVQNDKSMKRRFQWKPLFSPKK